MGTQSQDYTTSNMSPLVLPSCEFQQLTCAGLCGPILLQNQGRRSIADEANSLPSASLAVVVNIRGEGSPGFVSYMHKSETVLLNDERWVGHRNKTLPSPCSLM